jgi:hypothetical protein
VKKDRIEQLLYPHRAWILLAMVAAVLINLFTLLDRLEIFRTALIGQLLFGQAVVCYLYGWTISLGVGTMGSGAGRDLMGAFVLSGFVVMFFFRGY